MERDHEIKRDILYPLRKLYWWIFPMRVAYRKKVLQFRLWKRLIFPLGKKIYVIGTPNHENLGDSAIAMAQLQFLHSCGVPEERIKEITYDDYCRYRKQIHKWIPSGSMLAHLGGGHMGNQWMEEEQLHRDQVTLFPRNPSVIFPQTVFYTPDEEGQAEAKASTKIYDGKENLTMVAREQRSYQIMQELYPNTRILLTPDIVLSATMESFGAKSQTRKGVLLCLRDDAEKSMEQSAHDEIEALLCHQGLSYAYTDMYSADRVDPNTRGGEVRKKLEELASARLVITDRLHGMIFCALTGTPCIVFSNYNHKVRGTYEWIRYLPYIRYVTSAAEVADCLPQLLAMQACSFDGSPLRPHYDQLAEVVRNYANN